ncbi:hypothetical protein [Marinobacterium aestuariivivens]|uniref:Uncharacterized protein n=1 Tax=Marinobacterium aestuariivivens TaxID=1698799 RepID=A0ABW1ZSR9_9GAMM
MLLEAVGARGSQAFVTALNDYMVSVPIEDFNKQLVLLAMKADGIERGLEIDASAAGSYCGDTGRQWYR